ncbi:hypothetical protein IGI04_038590 [Brassica rapa subsp. trilocularis]|uniref:Uncharacterized protein n=1 Tax=Brassica rapa subsp. trilocularis TaxID=1813537 RepID=A0ABQ7LKN1_BRACM|nr:hypothetical protein IGI04_038590 [Brassica rapa subsp. trilocularis]
MGVIGYGCCWVWAKYGCGCFKPRKKNTQLNIPIWVWSNPTDRPTEVSSSGLGKRPESNIMSSYDHHSRLQQPIKEVGKSISEKLSNAVEYLHGERRTCLRTGRGEEHDRSEKNSIEPVRQTHSQGSSKKAKP